MDKNKLQQITVGLLVYISVLCIIFILPTRSWFINIVGLSFKVWLPFVVLLMIGVLFVFLHIVLVNFKRFTAAVFVGFIIGLIVNMPRIFLVMYDVLHYGISGEYSAVLFFAGPVIGISLFIAIMVGLLQNLIMNVYERIDYKKEFTILLIVFFVFTILFFGRAVYAYNRDLLIGCPYFKLNFYEIISDSSGCLDQAKVKNQKGMDVYSVEKIGLQFRYPKYWGKPNFHEANDSSGKIFSIPFRVYSSLQEIDQEGLVVRGVTENFLKNPGYYTYAPGEEEGCMFVQNVANFSLPLKGATYADMCNGVEEMETSFETIFYYKIPNSYEAVPGSNIHSNDGIAIVPLQHPEYKIIFIKKMVNTLEKEAEFKEFLQSFKSIFSSKVTR